MIWVFKCFVRRSKHPAEALSPWPYVTYVCDADGIVEADGMFERDLKFDPCDTKNRMTLRHCALSCFDAGCRCHMPLMIAVSH